ncbi:MAG: hypothetical protein AB8G77_10650 [Rhodothermales bacterium]
MFTPIRLTVIAVVFVSTSGCQTGQYQAAAGPSVGPGQTLEARCRQQASRASSNAGTGNIVKTVAAATVGGIVGNAIGGGINRYGYYPYGWHGGYYGHAGSYRGVGTVVGAGAGAAVGNSMAENPQAVYDVAYTNCMNHRYTGPR